MRRSSHTPVPLAEACGRLRERQMTPRLPSSFPPTSFPQNKGSSLKWQGGGGQTNSGLGETQSVKRYGSVCSRVCRHQRSSTVVTLCSPPQACDGTTTIKIPFENSQVLPAFCFCWFGFRDSQINSRVTKIHAIPVKRFDTHYLMQCFYFSVCTFYSVEAH